MIKVASTNNVYDQSISNVFLTIKVTCIFNRVLNVFLTITVTYLLYRVFSSPDLKHITSFWFNRLFMADLSYLLVISKKYTNTYGKDSKYTKVIDISIIWFYCRLYYRLFCRLFFVMQYLLFSFSFMSAASFSCFSGVVFSLPQSFLFNTKSTSIFISFM